MSGLNGGPSQVAFSPNGRRVAVGLWGVPHLAALAKEPYQSPSRVYVYNIKFSNDGIQFENPRFYEESGVSGTIGFSWGRRNNFIYATNFNVSAEKSEYSVTALGLRDRNTFNSGNGKASGNAGIPGSGEEACWSWLSENGKVLYAASFSQNSLSVFDVSRGRVTFRESVPRRGTSKPDTKDIFVIGDGTQTYVSGGYATHTMTIYDTQPNGTVVERSNSPYEVPASRPNGRNVSSEKHAYLGLIGYPDSYVGY